MFLLVKILGNFWDNYNFYTLSIIQFKYFQFFENENDAFNYIWFKKL